MDSDIWWNATKSDSLPVIFDANGDWLNSWQERRDSNLRPSYATSRRSNELNYSRIQTLISCDYRVFSGCPSIPKNFPKVP